jgi:4'-phosphopantetheinyl transferase
VDSVDVWLVSAEASEADLAVYASVLDSRERSRAAGARTETERRRYVSAHGAARIVLGRALGIEPDHLSFEHGQHGKPYLAGLDVHVNLSHSGDHSMVALSYQRPVGLDIQALMPALDATAMARRFFAHDEAALVAGWPEMGVAGVASRAEIFAQLWARKEAVIKAAGGRLMRGLAIPVHGDGPIEVDFPFEPSPGRYRVTDLATVPGYRAAIALAGRDDYRVTVEAA